MIKLSEISAAAEKYDVAAETIEKDYVISWILLSLSQSQLLENFIFYGGTAIKRIYFEDHRFSEDIDLISSKKFNIYHILNELTCFKFAKDKINLILEINHDKTEFHDDRAQFYISYSAYDEIVGAPKEIRLDFAMNRTSFGEKNNKTVIPSYTDLNNQKSKLSVMTLNTIIANKLGLLIDLTRNEPRDLYDIWFLLNRTERFNFDMGKMCCAFKDKYGFKPTLNIFEPYLKNENFKKYWESRLKNQLGTLPDIEIVTQDINIMLAEIFGSNI